MADNEDLMQFVIPYKHRPGTDLMTKRILQDQRIMNLILKTLIGRNAEDKHVSAACKWIDGSHSDILYAPKESATEALPPVIVQHFYDENKKLLVLKERMHHIKALASTYDDLERQNDDEDELEQGNEVDEADATKPADASIQMYYNKGEILVTSAIVMLPRLFHHHYMFISSSPNDTTNHPADAASPAYDSNHPADTTIPANVTGDSADATTYSESTYPDNRDHTKAYIRQLKEEFQNTYHRMDDSKKMRLANGKCVEDEIFYFGMQCSSEHQCHSFIIDPSDINWTKYHVFSEEELQEIEAYRAKPTPEMPVPLRDYLNQFNKSTTADLRKEIFKPLEFDQS